MRLLYLTYKVDSESSIVGHVVGWIKALSEKFSRVEVICLSYSGENLPVNVKVHSLPQGTGLNTIKRIMHFCSLLLNFRNSVQVVFCQFSPEYVIGVAPFALLFSWPVVFWYTHKQVSLKLRLATFFASRVVTASDKSFQINTNKKEIIGHGINVGRFRPRLGEVKEPSVILSVGRLASIKNYELLIDCIAYISNKYNSQDFELHIVGGEEDNLASGYRLLLQDKIKKLKLDDIVKLIGPISYKHMVETYLDASVHINLCPTGGLDKSVLEGMACGVPTLVLNNSFAELDQIPGGFEVLTSDHVEVISDKLVEYLNLSQHNRTINSDRIRRLVVEFHDEIKFIDKLSSSIQQLIKQ